MKKLLGVLFLAITLTTAISSPAIACGMEKSGDDGVKHSVEK